MALSILGTLVIWAKRNVCLFHLISAWCSFIVYMKAYYIIRSQFQIKMVKNIQDGVVLKVTKYLSPEDKTSSG